MGVARLQAHGYASPLEQSHSCSVGMLPLLSGNFPFPLARSHFNFGRSQLGLDAADITLLQNIPMENVRFLRMDRYCS